jgi:hypothetical protein
MPSVPGGKAAAKTAKLPGRSHWNCAYNFVTTSWSLPVRAGKHMKRSSKIERTGRCRTA